MPTSKNQQKERLSSLDILNESAIARTVEKKEDKEMKKSLPRKTNRSKVNLSLSVDTLLLISKIREKELQNSGKQSAQSRIIDNAVSDYAKSMGIELSND